MRESHCARCRIALKFTLRGGSARLLTMAMSQQTCSGKIIRFKPFQNVYDHIINGETEVVSEFTFQALKRTKCYCITDTSPHSIRVQSSSVTSSFLVPHTFDLQCNSMLLS